MIRMAPSRSKGLEMKNGAPKTVRTKRAAVTANGATATYNPTSAAVLPPITKPEIIQNGAQAKTSTTKAPVRFSRRSEEHTSELQSLMRSSYAVFCLKKKNKDR